MSQNTETTNQYLLTVDDLKTYFPIRKGILRRTVGHVKAVDGITFAVKPGQTFGLVGESGCGKTTAARSIVRLIPATSGRVAFDGIDVLSAGPDRMLDIRRNISVIFQDPYGSLNPRMTVGGIVGEALKVHQGVKGSELTDRVAALLERVGLFAECLNRYPHEFSGGQRQRIGVARALVLNPKLVICDEPVSALDVSIQSQILNLLKDLQDDFGLTYLFIAHDLAVVEFLCDVVAVMYLGKIVERAPGPELFSHPLHPYTLALMSAIPHVDPTLRGKRQALQGEVPSPANPPSGCPFHPRCPSATEACKKQTPPLEEQPNYEGHFIACWRVQNGKLATD